MSMNFNDKTDRVHASNFIRDYGHRKPLTLTDICISSRSDARYQMMLADAYLELVSIRIRKPTHPSWRARITETVALVESGRVEVDSHLVI